MLPFKRQRNRFATHETRRRRRWGQFQLKGGGEEGQGLVEATAGFLFLLLIILVMFEMVFLFASYISLLNASAQGAIRAAGHPDMQPGDEHYDEYLSDIQGEAIAGGLSWTDLHVNPPQLPSVVEPGAPITVTLQYTMTTPFGEIFFPFFGKFGLPSRYHIHATTAVPIR
jgi:hypothetical protein